MNNREKADKIFWFIICAAILVMFWIAIVGMMEAWGS